jgi:hypothetical protein
MVGKVAQKALKNPEKPLNREEKMTTENQTTTAPTEPKNTANQTRKLSSKLEEKKGNAVKPLSLRPNRSFKKNLSLKPLGLRSR